MGGSDSPKKNTSKGSVVMDASTKKSVVQKVKDMSLERESMRRSMTPGGEEGEGLLHTTPKIEEEKEEPQEEPRRRWVQTTCADLFFGGWIILNALVLAIETDLRSEDNDKNIGWFIGDSFFNTVFLVELILRLEAERLRWICSLWNIFDAGLVAVSIWDSWLMRILGLHGDLRFATLLRLFRLLRLVRVLRVLRLVRFLKELMLLMSGIKSACASMVWGLLLLGITIFICSLLITKLVGKSCCDPDDNFQNDMYRTYFGTMMRSAFTLFQFTMEFQPDICRDSWPDGIWLTLALMVYVGFTNITLLNTVASVIVDNIMTISENNKMQKELEKAETKEEELAKQINRFFTVDETGADSVIRLEQVWTDERMNDLLDLFGVEKQKAEYLFRVLDTDKSGTVSRSEFRERLLRVDMEVEMLDVMKVEHQLLNMNKTFIDLKADFEGQQKEILDLLTKIESKQQQGFKSHMQCAPGAMTRETWAPMTHGSRPLAEGAPKEVVVPMPAEHLGQGDARAQRLEERDPVDTQAYFDEKLDSAAQEGSRTIKLDEQPEEQGDTAEPKTAAMLDSLGTARPQSRLDVHDICPELGSHSPELERPQSRLGIQDVSPELRPCSPDVERINREALSLLETARSDRLRDAMTQTARDATTQTVEPVEVPYWRGGSPDSINIQGQYSDDGENFLV